MPRWARHLLGVMSAALIALASGGAAAMQFTAVPQPDGSVMLAASGEIVAGDGERLTKFVQSLPVTADVAGIRLASRGGLLFEAYRIAATIHTTGLNTVVDAHDKCASACFLIFAAGREKTVIGDGLIGVHSAANGGADDDEARSATTTMARMAGSFGVPPVILGKMVTTAPNSVAWLERDDLQLMGVIFKDAAAAPQPAPPAAAEAATPTATATPVSTEAETAASGAGGTEFFRQGKSDRAEFDRWFDGLTAEGRHGAAYWIKNRKGLLADKLSCAYWPSQIEFTRGCVEAQARTSVIDQRMAAERNYRAGWNSL